MQYQGGKFLQAPAIAKIINANRSSPDEVVTDAFCGGLSVAAAIGGRVICNDSNDALITMYLAIQGGWEPPDSVTEAEWRALKEREDRTDPAYAFAMIACTWGAKWGQGYARRAGGNNFARGSCRGLARKFRTLGRVTFKSCDYRDLEITPIMYCDPPYAGTAGYAGAPNKFDSDEFWEWAREVSKVATVYVSEYSAPADFMEIHSHRSNSRMVSGASTDNRLFVHGSHETP